MFYFIINCLQCYIFAELSFTECDMDPIVIVHCVSRTIYDNLINKLTAN